MSTPVFRVFIEIRGVLSFLKSVGLSNRFSNKLFLYLFLQRCNDQFGDVGISLQQTVRLFSGVVQWLFLRHISPFMEEIRLHRLCSISGAPRCCYGRTDLLSYRIARGWYPPAPWGGGCYLTVLRDGVRRQHQEIHRYVPSGRDRPFRPRASFLPGGI